MALSRRTGQRFQGSIWPGFVDAMTGLLLVLMFVLTIFMVVQFVLRETITGQESELNDLSLEVAALAQALGLEQLRSEELEDNVGQLSATLDTARAQAEAQNALIATLQQQSAEQENALTSARARITDFEAQVATLIAERDTALGNVASLQATQAELEAARDTLLTEQQALNLALATARTEIDAQVEAARLAAAQRDAMDALIADLQAQSETQQADLTARSLEIAELEAALSEEERARLLEAEAAEALRARLANADAELTAMTLALEQQRQEAEDTLTLLAAARAAQDSLDIELAAALATGAATTDAKAAVEAELSEVLTQLALARADLETRQSEQSETVRALQELQTERDALLARLAETEQGRDALQAALAQAETQLSAAQVTLEGEESRRQALADAIIDLAAERDLAQAALQTATENAEVTQSELSDEALRRAALEQALTDMTAARDASDTLVTQLRDDQAATARALALARVQIDALAAELADTRTALAKAEADLTRALDDSDVERSLAAALAAQQEAEANKAEVQRQLAAALAAKLAAEREVDVRLDEAAEKAVLLASAREALAEQEDLSAEAARRAELLNQQVAALRSQMNGLQQALNAAEASEADLQIQIQTFGTELNAALAREALEKSGRLEEETRRRELEEAERKRLEAEAKALQAEKQDLERYRSEFFGRLRDLLGTQEGVRISGDRFVFSSEVLFDPGQAELSTDGQAEVAKVAGILRSIADDIPAEIDWVIRVDGHTDNVPLSGLGEFADNWELSQARALSVVRYMVNFLGIPPGRLAANGFGQYQPINTADSDEARAQNRRIELKFTEK